MMRRAKWNDADRQAFRDGVRVRAHTIGGERFDGPDADEWDDEYVPNREDIEGDR